MKFFSIVFCSLLFFGPNPNLFAHTNHHHGKEKASLEKVKKEAKNHIERLIGKKKLNSSWKQAKFKRASKKKFKKRLEWVLSYENSSVSNPQKKVLYIFLSLYGDFIAANFTGK